MNSQTINSIKEKLQACENQNLSDIKTLNLLMSINNDIENEIKNITTDGEHTYASLLKLNIASVVFKTEIKNEKEILWSPKSYAEYQKIRKMITSQTGNLGKIITKDQYEQASKVLSKIH